MEKKVTLDNRPNTIGVIVPSLSEPFFSSAIDEIENVATEKACTVLIGQSHDDERRQLQILQTFLEQGIDGMLMSLGKNTQEIDFITLLQQAKVPIVFFDCVPEQEGVNKVYSDVSCGMQEAIQAFASMGHKNIALINGPQNLWASREREQAYQQALREEEIVYEEKYKVYTDLTEEGNIQAIDRLLSLPDRPSAIIAFNDFVTLDVIKYIRRKGLVQKKDIYFISYANYPLWKYMDSPPMGSIEQYPDLQGRKAAEILFQNMGSTAIAPQTVVFKSKLIMKEFNL